MSHMDEIKDIVQLVLNSPIYDFSLEYRDVKLSFKKENQSKQQPAGSGGGHTAEPGLTGQAAQTVQSGEPACSEQAVLTGTGITLTPSPCNPSTGVEKAAVEQEKQAELESLKEIVSSVVGTFYASAEPDAPPLVQIGDRITVNSVIGIVEAMKMYNDIIADTEGEVVDILVENGQLIQFGQPLFLVRTT